jgi:tRNA dihydrouridine synthase A
MAAAAASAAAAGRTAAAPAASGDILSIAPMMEWTDRHYRFMMRLLTKRTRLYTEMVVANTLLHSPQARGFLRFSPEEHPVACQIGGSDPEALARAAVLVEQMGYDEVNLNCGCPSPRVAGKGSFGARLMFSPELVRDCVAAMSAAVAIPVTVKCRLGADSMDSYEEFKAFVTTVAAGGCRHFIVHARKCLLKGLDPKGNRTVPKLKYDWVQRIALELPELRFSLNGGILHWEQAEQLLSLQRPAAEGAEGAAQWRCPSCGSSAAEQQASAPAAGAGAGMQAAAEEAGAAEARAAAELGAGQEAEAEVEAEAEAEAGAGGEAPPGGAGSGEGSMPKVKHDAHEDVLLPDSQFHPDAVRGAVRCASCRRSHFGASAGSSVLDCIMLGRAAYSRPWMFADADRRFFNEANPGLSRRELISAYLDYSEAVQQSAPAEERSMLQYKPFQLAKPLMGLFQGEFGGSRWRGALAQGLQDRKLSLREAVSEAMLMLPPAALEQRFAEPPPS